MSESAIRAAIVADLESVSGIGVVHNRQRFSRTYATFFNLMKSAGIVNGWMVHRQATPTSEANNAEVERAHVYTIVGVYDLDDENDSESTFQALVEAIFVVFRDDRTLSGICIDTALLNIESVETREYDNRLYHVCDLTLVVQERESYS